MKNTFPICQSSLCPHFYFDPRMDKLLPIFSKLCDEITYPFPNFNGCAVEVWEWISNVIPHYMMDVITDPC